MERPRCGHVESTSSAPCPLPKHHPGHCEGQVPHLMISVGVESSRHSGGQRRKDADTGCPFPEPPLSEAELSSMLNAAKIRFGHIMRARARASRAVK